MGELIKQLIEEEIVKRTIDSSYQFEILQDTVERIENHRVNGKIITRRIMYHKFKIIQWTKRNIEFVTVSLLQDFQA